MKALATIAAAAWAVAAGSAFAGQVAIPSPDGDAELRIEDDAGRFFALWRGETFAAAHRRGHPLHATAAVVLKLRGLGLV
jgi:hypothetical protein